MNRSRTRYLLPALTVLALVAAACASGMAGSAGAYLWPSGTKVTYEITSVEVTSMEQPGMGNMSFTTESGMEVDVEATGADRQFTITVTDASISSEAAAMGGEMPDIGALKGLASVVTLDERGLISDATNLEGNAGVIEVGGVDAFKESLQSLFLFMPEGGLGPGVEWSRQYSVTADQSGIVLTVESDDSYVCEERTTYEGLPAFRITVTGTATLSGSGEQQGMTLEFDGSGDAEGTIYVEVGTGMVLHAEGTATISGGIYVEAAGMSMPIEIRESSTIRPKK
jgi:hypothetical protein